MSSHSQVQSKNFLEDFLVGGTAATFSRTIFAPLKTLRRIRVVAARPAREYMADNILEFYKEEGLAGFWKGHTANIVRYFPTQALNFAFNDIFQRVLSPYNPKTEFSKFFLGNLAAGGAAGATSLAIIHPLDSLRITMEGDTSKVPEQRQYKGLSDCIKKVYKKEGLRGFYKGFGVTLPRAIIYRAMYFGGYDTAKKTIFMGRGKPGVFGEFVVAQGVTMVAQLVSWPLEIVRRRYLVSLVQKEAGKEKLYTGIMDCVKKIYEKEGGSAFYRGFNMSMVLAIAPALTLVLYDELQNMLHEEHLESLYE